MKKTTLFFVALILIALHALIFFLVIGHKNKVPTHKPLPSSLHAKTQSIKPKTTKPQKDAFVDGFDLPTLFPETKKSSTRPTPRRTTAPFKNKTGGLRTDLPNRRTTKIYSKLVRNPYRGAIVVDAKTGQILFKDHETSYAYPASVTKLMTLIIVLDHINSGQIHLTDKVKITNEIAKIGGSQIWLDPKEKNFTVDDLLYALMVHSANDAAYALALHVAGTREKFVAMMNQKARELGMNATRYHSPHGLPPSRGQPDISTPYDIALLSLAALRYPQTLHYTHTELKYLRNGKTMMATRNKLVRKSGGYPGCDGLKTGYHGKGGWSIAATAQRGNHRIVAVLLGCPDKKTRMAQARKLLDKGFEALEK